MPLTDNQKALQKRIYQRTKVDEPIEPTDERYVPIYENLSNDPIEELKTTIDLLEVESIQFFSGFRGSGKTTQLFRLRQNLEDEGYFVIYANALEYVNPATELGITELLIAIAGAFSDALEEKLGKDIVNESYWTRLWHYLNKTNVDITEFGVSDIGSAFNMKAILKSTPSFRQKLQDSIRDRIDELKNNVDKFIEDGVKLIQSRTSKDIKIVFIFDQLEQIRGSLSDEENVLKSVEQIFTLNTHLLKLNYLNTIYTVPPWLRFVMTSENIVTLRGIKQWENDEKRTKYGKGNNIFRQIIEKRFEPDGIETFFGKGKEKENKLNKFVDSCGGSLRQLLRLINISLLRIKDAPFSDELIDGAISELENSFTITIEDAFWLDKIAKSRAESLLNTNNENVNKLTRLIDTHLVLYFRNGKDWYDIHPLTRKKVAEIIKQNPKKNK